MPKPTPRPAAAAPCPSVTVQVLDPTPQTPAVVAVRLPGGGRALMHPSQARSLAIILGTAADLAEELQTIHEEVQAADLDALVVLAQVQAGGN